MSFDADLELARQLQAEEDQLARQRHSTTSGPDALKAFLGRLTSSLHGVLEYEDPILQARALSVIPLEQVCEA
jgi:hypothetical protein